MLDPTNNGMGQRSIRFLLFDQSVNLVKLREFHYDPPNQPWAFPLIKYLCWHFYPFGLESGWHFFLQLTNRSGPGWPIFAMLMNLCMADNVMRLQFFAIDINMKCHMKISFTIASAAIYKF